MHSPRTILLQTLGHFVLGHAAPRDFADFLRQRVEANYFAAAVLVPERPRGPVPGRGQGSAGPVRGGPARRVLGLVRDGRAPVHQPGHPSPGPDLPLREERRRAASSTRRTRTTAWCCPPTPPGRSRDSGCAGSGRAARCSRSADRFSPYYQYSDTPSGTYWCVAHVDPGPERGFAITLGTPYEHSRWFRGRDTTTRMVSRCPDGDCCQRPPASLAARWEGMAWPSARAHSHILSALPTGQSSRAWTKPMCMSSWNGTTVNEARFGATCSVATVSCYSPVTYVRDGPVDPRGARMSSAPDAPAGFSLELGPDLREMRDWVHGFADNVIRPAAAEWDEREETPWPILEEAAKIGLYSLDFFAEQWLGPSRAGHPDRVRGAVLGRRGHRAVPGRQLAGRGRGGQQRHPRADRRVAAADVRRARRRQAGRVLLLRAGRGQRRRRHPDPGGLRRGHRRVGAERHQDLGHQRRHRRRARGGGVGRPDAGQPRPGQLHRAAGHGRAVARGRSSASTASAPRTLPRSCWTGCGCPAAAWSAARTGWTTGWPGSGAAAAPASRRR